MTAEGNLNRLHLCCLSPCVGEPFAEKINGQAGGTWTLPLEPLSATSFEPYSAGDNPVNDSYYAGLCVSLQLKYML